MRKIVLTTVLFAAIAVLQISSVSPTYAFNPRAFIMKEKMQKAEESLKKAETSKGSKRLDYLEEHIKLERKNIESLGQELTHINSETNRMNHKTTLTQLIAHEKMMEKYHLTMVKMLHQMVRSQALILKAIKESSH